MTGSKRKKVMPAIKSGLRKAASKAVDVVLWPIRGCIGGRKKSKNGGKGWPVETESRAAGPVGAGHSPAPAQAKKDDQVNVATGAVVEPVTRSQNAPKSSADQAPTHPQPSKARAVLKATHRKVPALAGFPLPARVLKRMAAAQRSTPLLQPKPAIALTRSCAGMGSGRDVVVLLNGQPVSVRVALCAVATGNALLPISRLSAPKTRLSAGAAACALAPAGAVLRSRSLVVRSQLPAGLSLTMRAAGRCSDAVPLGAKTVTVCDAALAMLAGATGCVDMTTVKCVGVEYMPGVGVMVCALTTDRVSGLKEVVRTFVSIPTLALTTTHTSHLPLTFSPSVLRVAARALCATVAPAAGYSALISQAQDTRCFMPSVRSMGTSARVVCSRPPLSPAPFLQPRIPAHAQTLLCAGCGSGRGIAVQPVRLTETGCVMLDTRVLCISPQQFTRPACPAALPAVRASETTAKHTHNTHTDKESLCVKPSTVWADTTALVRQLYSTRLATRVYEVVVCVPVGSTLTPTSRITRCNRRVSVTVVESSLLSRNVTHGADTQQSSSTCEGTTGAHTHSAQAAPRTRKSKAQRRREAKQRARTAAHCGSGAHATAGDAGAGGCATLAHAGSSAPAPAPCRDASPAQALVRAEHSLTDSLLCPVGAVPCLSRECSSVDTHSVCLSSAHSDASVSLGSHSSGEGSYGELSDTHTEESDSETHTEGFDGHSDKDSSTDTDTHIDSSTVGEQWTPEPQQHEQTPHKPPPAPLVPPLDMHDIKTNPNKAGAVQVQELGEGASGRVDVYTFNMFGDQQVAFKQSQLFDKHGTLDSALVYYFERECIAYKQIAKVGGHPNVMRALALGMDKETGWGGLVTPLMHGNVERLYAQYGAGTAPGSQRALLTGRPLAQIVRHCQQMLQGVQWLHETAKLAHYDIKPANLLLTKEEVVKLADFGTITMAIPDKERDHVTEQLVTPTREWPGMTTLYAAREILEISPQSTGAMPGSGHYDFRADVVSCALTAHWCITGGFQIRDVNTDRETFEWQVTRFQTYVEPGLIKDTLRHTCNPVLPDGLRAVLEAAMSHNPADRPSLQNISHALDAALPELLRIQRQEEEAARRAMQAQLAQAGLQEQQWQPQQPHTPGPLEWQPQQPHTTAQLSAQAQMWQQQSLPQAQLFDQLWQPLQPAPQAQLAQSQYEQQLQRPQQQWGYQPLHTQQWPQHQQQRGYQNLHTQQQQQWAYGQPVMQSQYDQSWLHPHQLGYQQTTAQQQQYGQSWQQWPPQQQLAHQPQQPTQWNFDHPWPRQQQQQQQQQQQGMPQGTQDIWGIYRRS